MMSRTLKRCLIALPVFGGFGYYCNSTLKSVFTGVRAECSASAGSGEGGAAIENSLENERQLISVQVFFRHGARSPFKRTPALEKVCTHNYDKEFFDRVVPHAEIPYEVINALDGGPRPPAPREKITKDSILQGGMPVAMLTKQGKDQAYVLGHKLRRLYMEQQQLVSGFNPDIVHIQSTNATRCILTLRSVLAGMFGANNFKEPVRIPVLPEEEEFMRRSKTHCPVLTSFMTQVEITLNQTEEWNNIKRIIEKNTGASLGKLYRMTGWYDQVSVGKTHGLPMPDWLLAIEDRVHSAAYNYFLQYLSGTPHDRTRILPLSVGRVYGVIKQNMANVIQDKSSCPRMYLYACHDTSLTPMLEVLQQFTDAWPPYTADLRFELYQDKHQQHWVKIMYCDKEYIPKNSRSPWMTYKEFENLADPYIVTKEYRKKLCHDPKAAKKHGELVAKQISERN